MAFGTEKLSYLIDIMTSGAQKDLKQLGNTADRELGKSGKAFDGFKAKGTAAFDTVKANAGMFAAAAGASLVAFGAKAAQEFADSALAAGKFSDATGIATEDASRWIEVASDVGVSADIMQGAFIRMEKAVAANSPAFQQLGVDVKYAADGTVDANATMVEAIETLNGIEDPAKRAEAASVLFGRGFAEAAEIVLADADDITKALEGVSDAQVFDDDEVKKAREFRAAMDDLNDKLDQLKMTVGEGLVPALSDAAEQLTMVVEAAEDLKLVDLASTLQEWDFVTPTGQARQLAKALRGDVVFSLKDFKGSAEELRAELERQGADEAEIQLFLTAYAAKQAEAAAATEETTSAATEAAPSLQQMADKTEAASEAAGKLAAELPPTNSELRKMSEGADDVYDGINDVKSAFEALRNELSDESAYLDVQDEFDNVRSAAEDAYIAAAEGADDAASKARDYRQAQIQLTQKVADYAEEVGNIPPETVTEIQAMIDAGLLAEAQARLDALVVPRTAVINTVTRNVSRNPNGTSQTFIPVEGAGATGGIVNRPTVALIGESGPEAIVPLNQTRGNGPLSGLGAGSTFNITVHAGINADGPEIGRIIANKLREYQRFNGPGR
jgi:hypothetical protein